VDGSSRFTRFPLHTFRLSNKPTGDRDNKSSGSSNNRVPCRIDDDTSSNNPHGRPWAYEWPVDNTYANSSRWILDYDTPTDDTVRYRNRTNIWD
jgi:hypothetical protein